MLSCHVSSLFAIFHVDVWIPGHHTNSNGKIALMNTICDVSQFAVYIPMLDESSSSLVSHFIQRVFMTFGLCHLAALNGDTFKEDFIAMY